MAFLLIPVILLAVVWLSYVRRRLSELNENVNTAMNQIGLQLSSRFRALEALLELDGRQVTDAVVDEVFANFCVGK